MMVNMKFSSFKYILTDIGGGWGTIHSLYGVTSNGDVYVTQKFDDGKFTLETELECELIGRLDNVELGLNEVHYYAIMDGSYLTLYDVHDNFKVLHYCDTHTESDPEMFKRIKCLESDYRDKKSQERMKDNTCVYVGEVKTASSFREAMELMNASCHTQVTFHSRGNKALAEFIAEQIMGDKKGK